MSRLLVAVVVIGMLLALAGGMLFTLTGCQLFTPEVTFVYRNDGEITNLSPGLGAGTVDRSAQYPIYSKLFYTLPNDRGTLIPDLATSWSCTSDGLEYTVNLRKGVKWHFDYGEVKASDVVFSFKRMMDPNLGSRHHTDFASLKDVWAVGDYTVKFTLKGPDPRVLFALSRDGGFIGCEKAMRERGEAHNFQPVGSGPFYVAKYTQGQEIVYKRVPNHHLTKGNVTTLIYKFMPDETTAALALQTGQIDAGYFLVPEVQAELRDDSRVHVEMRPQPSVHNIQFINHEGRPQTDVRVRQAAAFAIDRDSIVKNLLGGLGQAAHSLISPVQFGYVDTKFFPYDPEKAESLLTEAGYLNTSKWDPEMEYYAYTSGITPDLTLVTEQQLEAVGFILDTEVMERAVWQVVRNNRERDMGCAPFGRDESETMIFERVDSGGIPFPNVFDYTGADDLTSKLRYERDVAVRKQLIGDIMGRLAQDVPIVPIVHQMICLAMNPKVEPFEPSSGWVPAWLVVKNK